MLLRTRGKILLVAIVAIVALATPAGAQLTRDQQKCVLALNKGLAKTAGAIGKETLACIKDHNQGAVAGIPACLAGDGDGKVAKAAAKVTLDFERRCAGAGGDGTPKLPVALATDAGTVAAAATGNGRRMLAALYGADVGAAALTEAENESGAQDVDLTVAFPHCGSSDPEVVHGCLEDPVACAACVALNAADDLEADCDLLDDGAANASCLRPLELLVPAYANPCCDGGPQMWSTLADVAATAAVRVNVILNPASGPGASPIDPNYVADAATGPLLDVRGAGAVVFGYVTTSYAARDAADVKADVDRYYTLAYWRGAGIQVDGIFFDEVSNDLADVGYYQELRDHVHGKGPGARVIGNPGVATTFDSSGGLAGFTVADYAAIADTLVTFEHDGNEYRTNYTAPAWVGDLPARRFAHLVHGEAATGDMETDVALARARKAGMLYVTDDVLSPNPWDALATYLAAELPDLSGL